MNVRSINTFIKTELVKRIWKDSRRYRILNERDLESLAYHLLRARLRNNNDVKISTNFTATGISWKQKSGGAGKFIQPDIAILESKDKSHKPKMHIAIELKARTPGKAAAQGPDEYRTLFSSRPLQKDFRKLNRLKEAGIIDTGYFLYLYFDTINDEDTVEKILGKGVRKKHIKKRFETSMINKFENPKTGELFDDYKAEKFRHRSRQLYRFYAGKNDRNLWKKFPTCHEVFPHKKESDQIKHGKKKNKKPRRSGGKQSAQSVKAWNGSVLLIARMRPETRRERGLRMPTKKQIATARKKRKK